MVINPLSNNNNKVYVNRTLNLKRIKYIGLDMDHTLIRYHNRSFEGLSYQLMKDKLVQNKKYPSVVRQFEFNYDLTIRGLVIDRKKGNLLKLNRHSAIRASSQGTKRMEFKSQQQMYKSIYIDLSDKEYLAIDTTFSISLATLYSQLIDLKIMDKSLDLPGNATMADDCLEALDDAHRDGSLKNLVKQDLNKYIIKEPEVVLGLEKYKRHGKKLFIVTNSDFHYTKLLLDYAVNPYLKEHKTWQDLFELVITSAQKPRFFYDRLKFLHVNPHDGTMVNLPDLLTPGIYQGGDAQKFTRDLNLQGDEILYIGDHIYGDILRLKKDCGWRTAMVIDELAHEVETNKIAKPIADEIETLMRKKEPLENKLTDLATKKVEKKEPIDDNELDTLQKQIAAIDLEISNLIKQQQTLYNPNWGPLMRAGNEESYFAYQVDRYACVYVAKLADLLTLSPRTYFRAPRRPLAHELY